MTQCLRRATLAVVLLSFCVGCKKAPVDHIVDYITALNTYYAENPSCLWAHSQQLPFQVAASDTEKNAPFAALVDMGLLMRTTVQKRIIIITKDEIDYDLSVAGRAAWTPDASQPGFGNFCYGTRTVLWIGHSTPNNAKPGATTDVIFGYVFHGAPDWVKTPEIQNAFPQVRTDLDGTGSGIATSTLVDTESGWQVKTPPVVVPPKPKTPADGKIVE
jgi:hypothetical protein